MAFRPRRYPPITVDGSVVVITGGARGIGRCTAELFAARGATVWIGDLDADVAQETAQALPGDVRAHRLDVTSKQSWQEFCAKILAEVEHIDIVVNNAGVMPLGGFLDEPDSLSALTIDVNVWGPLHGMRAVLPGMTPAAEDTSSTSPRWQARWPFPGWPCTTRASMRR